MFLELGLKTCILRKMFFFLRNKTANGKDTFLTEAIKYISLLHIKAMVTFYKPNVV